MRRSCRASLPSALQSVPQMVRIVTESVLYVLEISKKQASIKGCKGSKELGLAGSATVRRFVWIRRFVWRGALVVRRPNLPVAVAVQQTRVLQPFVRTPKMRSTAAARDGAPKPTISGCRAGNQPPSPSPADIGKNWRPDLAGSPVNLAAAAAAAAAAALLAGRVATSESRSPAGRDSISAR
eukprot:scaffold34055_cov58-Phaeocystis_antarctica.AAC.1